MTFFAGLLVCALLATELAGVLYLSSRVRGRRKRHQTGFTTRRFPFITPRRLL